MLDQNTDRMWYVIGAVLIGAAIIFGMNSLMPNAFAGVGDAMISLTDSIEQYNTLNQGVIGEDIEHVKTYNPVTNLTSWNGSTINPEYDVPFPEAQGGVGTRFSVHGGSGRMKAFDGLIIGARDIEDRDLFLYDVEVKNIGDEPFYVSDNYILYEKIEPGEFKVVRAQVRPRKAHFQFRLGAESPEGKIDALVGRLVVGRIVYGEVD